MQPDADGSRGFSFVRTLAVAVPVAVLTAFLMQSWGASVQRTASEQLNRDVLAVMLPDWAASDELADEYQDTDADLVADTPADAAKLQSPETLVFSYIPGSPSDQDADPRADAATWQAMLDAIGQSTGKSVELQVFEDLDEQLAAVRAGQLHILGVGTGAAPLAVNTAGFVPLCTMAAEDGSVGYTMKLLVAAGSGVKDLAGVKGQKVEFVRPTSNSGFKAAFVELYEGAKLLPERDYDWSFSLSHETSVKDVVQGRAEVAPVASDILAKMVENGEVKQEEFTVLYESEAFPPAVIGCAHDLPAEVVEQIRSAMVQLSWSGTPLADEFGPMGAARFVGVNYKDDWANIRRIDAAVGALANPR